MIGQSVMSPSELAMRQVYKRSGEGISATAWENSKSAASAREASIKSSRRLAWPEGVSYKFSRVVQPQGKEHGASAAVYIAELDRFFREKIVDLIVGEEDSLVVRLRKPSHAIAHHCRENRRDSHCCILGLRFVVRPPHPSRLTPVWADGIKAALVGLK